MFGAGISAPGIANASVMAPMGQGSSGAVALSFLITRGSLCRRSSWSSLAGGSICWRRLLVVGTIDGNSWRAQEDAFRNNNYLKKTSIPLGYSVFKLYTVNSKCTSIIIKCFRQFIC